MTFREGIQFNKQHFSHNTLAEVNKRGVNKGGVEFWGNVFGENPNNVC